MPQFHKGFVDLFYDFWIQKSHHFYNFWIQKFCSSIFTISGSRNCSISAVSGSRNCTISTISGSRNFLVHIHDFWIQKLQYFSSFWIQKLHHFYNFWIVKRGKLEKEITDTLNKLPQSERKKIEAEQERKRKQAGLEVPHSRFKIDLSAKKRWVGTD